MRLSPALLILVLAFCIPPGDGSASADKLAAKPGLQLCFVPLGNYDKGLIENARRGSAYLYGAQARILPEQELPKKAFYKPRKRYRAEKLLDHLGTVLGQESSCDVLVGFTAVDISTTKDEHVDWGVLGLGEIAGKSCVVSSFRMKRKAKRTTQIRRAVSTTNHEIGHVLGAPHGGAPGCLMNDAQGTVRTIDAEHGLLCQESRALIEEHIGHALPILENFDWDQILEP